MQGVVSPLVNGFRGRSKLTLWPLVFAIFCLVSGGPNGIEGAVGELGPSMALIMILVTPVIWALPAALMTAELASAMPEEGGYVVWVQEAMGPFGAYLCAWWSWLYSIVDSAMYPVMFAKTLALAVHLFEPSSILDQPWGQALAAILLILAVTTINILGVKEVGKSATILTVLILLPFGAMVWGGAFSHPELHLQIFSRKDVSMGAFGATGLAVVMWNYLGWDCLSTISGEIKNAPKTFPRALFIALALITLGYVIPIISALRIVPNAGDWQEGAWPTIATRVAGPLVGYLVLLGALASWAAMFLSQMLASSRIPFVLAVDGMLPATLGTISQRFGTPVRSIIFCAFCYAMMSWIAFKDLALANVILYGAGILLEFASLAILRWKRPEMHRPFKIQGGWFGISLVCLMPSLLMVLLLKTTLETSKPLQWVPILIALISGPVAYALTLYIKRAQTQAT